ncbi:hypothetical protein IZY60_12180 [Lutibacter sp. B2]|nr:hypothetical protein [Lutibacter sp. B2]
MKIVVAHLYPDLLNKKQNSTYEKKTNNNNEKSFQEYIRDCSNRLEQTNIIYKRNTLA